MKPESRCRRRCCSGFCRRASSTRLARSNSPLRLGRSRLPWSRSPGGSTFLAFEKKELERIGMPDAIVMRHRTTHFQHIFSGDAIRPAITAISGRKFSSRWFEAFERAAIFLIPRSRRGCMNMSIRRLQPRSGDAYKGSRGRLPSPKRCCANAVSPRRRGVIASRRSVLVIIAGKRRNRQKFRRLPRSRPVHPRSSRGHG